MKAITLPIILAVASLSGLLPGSLLLAAEPAPGSDQPAVKATPAKAGHPDKGDDRSNDERAVAGVDEAEAPVTDRAAKDKAAPEKSPAAQSPAAQSDEPGPAGSAADKAASPQRFVPSEQVRADFDVSFPIDM